MNPVHDDQPLSDTLTQSEAQNPGVVGPTLIAEQPGITLYTFTLTADQMVELCRVERFGEHQMGVNRRFSEDKAIEIADAMLKPETIFAENPLGSLEGDWRLIDGHWHYGVGAYISLDDGQHRRAALELLNPEERKRWTFTFTVTHGAPYHVRLKAFMQQTKRRNLDARLMLQMKAEVGEWRSDAEGRAYALCVELNNDPRSPLKDMVILGEQDKRPYEGRHRPVGINVKGLHLTFTSLMSKNSPLAQLSPEKQREVCKNMIMAAATVWPNAWKSKKHILTSARGVNAVLKLMVSGKAFKMAVSNDFTFENLVKVFTYAGKFDWTAKRAVHETERSITERLDNAIERGITKEMESITSPDDVKV